MVKGLWGKKIGMTQVFSEEQRVIPVTVIDISHWYITQIKTQARDGYNAVKLGNVKTKYTSQQFSQEWLKEPRKYFSVFKEVPVGEPNQELVVGQPADSSTVFTKGDTVQVTGITKGAGFQGVVKRHGFSGGRASHGSTFGRFTGGLSFMRSRGRVIKGKRMPGHMGVAQRTQQNLEIVRVEPQAGVMLVSGSIPGKSGSLVFVKKHNE